MFPDLGGFTFHNNENAEVKNIYQIDVKYRLKYWHFCKYASYSNFTGKIIINK